MTEVEAINCLKSYLDTASYNFDSGKRMTMDELRESCLVSYESVTAFLMAITALEESSRYREIGTVEEFRVLKEYIK